MSIPQAVSLSHTAVCNCVHHASKNFVVVNTSTATIAAFALS